LVYGKRITRGSSNISMLATFGKGRAEVGNPAKEARAGIYFLVDDRGTRGKKGLANEVGQLIQQRIEKDAIPRKVAKSKENKG